MLTEHLPGADRLRVKRTTHVSLMPILRMRGAIPLLLRVPISGAYLGT